AGGGGGEGRNGAGGREAPPAAGRLRAGGRRAAAVVAAALPPRRCGVDEGFVFYDDLWSEDDPQLFMIRERPASRTADRVLAWLDGWSRSVRRPPFFLWVHFFDPHQPYNPRSFDLTALTPTPYDAEIAEADRGVGRLVGWLRR